MSEFFNTYGVFLLVVLAIFYPLLITRNTTHAFKVVASLFVTFLVTLVLKELFTTTRPYLQENREALAGLTQFSSFPSSHTALAFAAATSVGYRKRTIGILLFFAALLVGVGRVIANVHYPQDIIFGILIGVLISVFIENLRVPLRLKSVKK